MADQRRVLVTRPEPGAAATAARLTAMGFAPVLAPCLIRGTVAPASLPPPAAVQAVLASSAAALPGLPAGFHAHLLLAVGEATAAQARDAGFSNVLSADGDAADLVALATRRCTPAAGPLLLATGAGQGGALAAGLRAHGLRVLRRVVYRASPVSRLPPPALHALQAGAVHAALFFSAETVHAFLRALPPFARPALAATDALALSPRIAELLKPLPWRRVRVALRPTQEELLALLHE